MLENSEGQIKAEVSDQRQAAHPPPLSFSLQTGDLGLDIGAQGEPLGYRQEGKSPSDLWLAGGTPRRNTGGIKMSHTHTRSTRLQQQNQSELIFLH